MSAGTALDNETRSLGSTWAPLVFRLDGLDWDLGGFGYTGCLWAQHVAGAGGQQLHGLPMGSACGRCGGSAAARFAYGLSMWQVRGVTPSTVRG